jgi:hypothetical protein
MENVQVISADSHVVEPTDVWETRLDRKFRDGRRESFGGMRGTSGDLGVSRLVRTSHVIAS